MAAASDQVFPCPLIHSCCRTFSTYIGLHLHWSKMHREQGPIAAAILSQETLPRLVESEESFEDCDTVLTPSTAPEAASIVMDHIDKMKYRYYDTNAQVNRAKAMMQDVLRNVQTTDGDTSAFAQPLINAIDSINSRRREATSRKERSSATHPPLKVYPRLLGKRPTGKRKLKQGSPAYAYDTNWKEVLEREFAYDPQLLTEVILAHEHWLTRSRHLRQAGWRDPSRTFDDVCDGQLFQEHPELGNPDYTGPTRLAFEGYCDDVDVPNPIGTAAGHHKLFISFFTVLNRPPKSRATLLSIHLATICLASDFKLFGPRQVISGTGDDNSIGGNMRRFDASITLKTPVASGLGSLQARGWLVVWTADGMAQGEVYGTNSSFSACVNPCNLCTNMDRRQVDMRKPSGFLSCTCGKSKHSRNCSCVFQLRTVADDKQLPRLSKAELQKRGVTTLQHGFVDVPHIHVAHPGPKEPMHAFCEGRSKQLGAATLWSVKAEGWATEKQAALARPSPLPHHSPRPCLISLLSHF